MKGSTRYYGHKRHNKLFVSYSAGLNDNYVKGVELAGSVLADFREDMRD